MKKIRQPPYQKKYERQLERALAEMVRDISKTYRRDVIESLDKKTVEKFEDAPQRGNYASILKRLANAAQSKIAKRFSNDKIQKLIDKVLDGSDDAARKQLYGAVEGAIGISTKQLTKDEGMTSELDALKIETSQWVEKLRDDTLSEYTANTLRGMSQGQGLDEILSKYDGLTEKRVNHAKFTARNQIQNFNAVSSKLRVQKLGIKKGIWRSADDARVRPSHADRDDKEYDLSKGLYSSLDQQYLIAGVDYQCRCYTEYVLDDD